MADKFFVYRLVLLYKAIYTHHEAYVLALKKSILNLKNSDAVSFRVVLNL